MVRIKTNNDTEILVNDKLVFKDTEGVWVSQSELTDLELKYARKHLDTLNGELYVKEPCKELDNVNCPVYIRVISSIVTCETTVLKCANCGLESKPKTDCV